MKTIRNLLSLAAVLAMAQPAPAAVPSTINYQGRLTDSLGVVQTGTKAMSLKIYDAATAGTQLYAETIGNVTVDANGVYGFQFGAAGTSDSLVTETLATTDGTSLTYQKTLSHSPAIAGTASVTDGTYSWNETTGNPGSPAAATATIISGFVVGATVTSGGSGYTSPPAVSITGNGTGAAATATVSSGAVSEITITNAGSGYTTGATISIAPPPAPFVINYSGNTITATYASAPAAGQTITATYRYSANGISGALAAGSDQWLELTVAGTVQNPRQKLLAVPFAMNAERASVATSLEKKIKTCQLIVSTSTTGDRRILPASVSPNNIGNGASDSFYKKINSDTFVVHSLSSEVVVSTTATQYYPPAATIELVAYTKTGARIVVASQTRSTSGSISLSGPFALNCDQNEYLLECSISTGSNSSGQANTTTTLNPIEMKYEN
jgi:hypothetical protein